MSIVEVEQILFSVGIAEVFLKCDDELQAFCFSMAVCMCYVAIKYDDDDVQAYVYGPIYAVEIN